MQAVVDALEEQQAELVALLDPHHEETWVTPTPRCPGWTVSDVVLHLAQTNEMAAASLDGRFADVVAALAEGLPPTADVDAGVELMVGRERGLSPSELYARLVDGARALVERFRAADPHSRVTWVAGELSAHTLATTRLAETWIHTGDVADALGVEPAHTARLRHIARLAWRTLPYAFARGNRVLHGPVGLVLTGPDGDRWEFMPEDGAPVTTVNGDAVELCLVAARRRAPADTSLSGTGPDAEAVLELIRTYA